MTRPPKAPPPPPALTLKDFARDPALLERARQLAVASLWERGDLDYKLHATQLRILEALNRSHESGHPKFFVLCSRRTGKSFMLLCLAFSQALRKSNSRVLFLAPLAKDAATIATDLAQQILLDCPDYLKPDYRALDKEFHFRNGSVIRLKGTNGEHAQYLRGGAADLIIIDEAGMVDDLKFVVSDVCMPMTLTTNGRIFLASTPPRSPGHESAEIFEQLAGSRDTAVFTIRDSPHITYEQKVRCLVEAGESEEDVPEILKGKREPKSTTAQREYFCRFVTDAESAVVKEFTLQAASEIVRHYDRPPFFDPYVAIDPGMKDRTGILFGYWDFPNARLVIEDEALLPGPNTAEIAEAIKSREEELWPGRVPLARVSDVDLRLIADLYAMHGLVVSPTKKADLLGAVNLLRHDVQTRTLVINPRCVNLIRQLTNATWNRKATEFERGGEIDGHFDLLAAAVYLARSVIRSHNPYPANYYVPGGAGGVPANTWVSPRRSKPKGTGLLGDTPLARRLIRRAKY